MGSSEEISEQRRLLAQAALYYEMAFTQGAAFLAMAREQLAQAEAMARQAGDDDTLAAVLGLWAAVLRAGAGRDDIARAVDYLRQQVGLLEAQGRGQEAAEAMSNLPALYRDLATVDPEHALAYLHEGLRAGEEALGRAAELDARGAMAATSAHLGDLCLILADADAEREDEYLQVAAGLYGKADQTFGDRDRDGQVLARLGLAETYIRMGKNLEGARDFLHEALDFYSRHEGGEVTYQVAFVYSLLARLEDTMGDHAAAREHREQAITLWRNLGFSPEVRT